MAGFSETLRKSHVPMRLPLATVLAALAVAFVGLGLLLDTLPHAPD